jgi:5-methylcytosine-specific restriction endonuclease McrA
MRQTLLLDSSYYPLQIIGWRKALSLFFTERAEVVEHHDNVTISSPYEQYQLPKVMRLFSKRGKLNEVSFNRLNVFYRDGFTCQYCNLKFKVGELTLDHVHPKSKGGDTSWKNIVTACANCNVKKSDHLTHECGMIPLKAPREPKWMSMFLLKLSQHEKYIWKDWFYSS